MIIERTFVCSAARPVRVLGAALALLVPLFAAPGCGSKPPPPPGAEKDTGLPEVDLGSGTESGEEAKSELSHGVGGDDAGKGGAANGDSSGKSDGGESKDESKAAPDASGKPAVEDDAKSTDEDSTDSEKESTATKG